MHIANTLFHPNHPKKMQIKSASSKIKEMILYISANGCQKN